MYFRLLSIYLLNSKTTGVHHCAQFTGPETRNPGLVHVMQALLQLTFIPIPGWWFEIVGHSL